MSTTPTRARATVVGPGQSFPALRWWRRPWTVPLAGLVMAALVYIWASYITFDPRTATVELPADEPLKYPIVLAHIVFGSVAVSTVVLQVWPWVRRRYPRVHRRLGRVYVLGGVAPCAGLAVYLLSSIAGPPWAAWTSRVALEGLWILTTAVGVVAARRGDLARHRWAMLSSFALTMDTFTSRFLKVLLMPLYPAMIDEAAFLLLVGWGWVVNLLLVQAWLFRTARRSREDARTAAATPRWDSEFGIQGSRRGAT